MSACVCPLQDCKTDDFEFLDSQLLLFGKMCQVCTYTCTGCIYIHVHCWSWVQSSNTCLQGNNERCIEALDRDQLRYVTFEQALWCVRCPQLHPSVASKYVELIKGTLGGGSRTCISMYTHVLYMYIVRGGFHPPAVA